MRDMTMSKRKKRTEDKRTLLPRRLLDLAGVADAHEAVVRLELLQRLDAVVHEREPRALAAAVLRPEAEDADLVLGCFVHFREFGPELVLGDVGAVGVEDVTVFVVQC